MRDPVELILDRSKRNKQLAVELYCECYIYQHYDSRLQDSWTEKKPVSWFENFCRRIQDILHDHRISVEIDTSDLARLYDNHEVLKDYAST